MHGIDQSTGKAAMAYVGSEGTPWHTLGTSIQKDATIEQIEEAAVLGWKVLQRPPIFQLNDKQFITDETHSGLIRSDTLMVLDIAGPDYVPHQNREVLEFFREYVEAGDMFIDTAGSLNGGKQIWVLAKMNQSFTLPGKDRVEGYVLLMNPHQYGKGMIAKFTTIRVVCQNTLMMSLGAGGKSIKLWHTSEFDAPRRKLAKENLGIAKERLDAFKVDAQTLAKLNLNIEDAVKLIAPVFRGDAKNPLSQQNRTVTRIIELYNGAGKGSELTSSKGTGWGLLNAVTEYIDHEYGRSANSRLNNAWLGTGDVQKREVLGLLLNAARG